MGQLAVSEILSLRGPLPIGPDISAISLADFLDLDKEQNRRLVQELRNLGQPSLVFQAIRLSPPEYLKEEFLKTLASYSEKPFQIAKISVEIKLNKDPFEKAQITSALTLDSRPAGDTQELSIVITGGRWTLLASSQKVGLASRIAYLTDQEFAQQVITLDDLAAKPKLKVKVAKEAPIRPWEIEDFNKPADARLLAEIIDILTKKSALGKNLACLKPALCRSFYPKTSAIFPFLPFGKSLFAAWYETHFPLLLSFPLLAMKEYRLDPQTGQVILSENIADYARDLYIEYAFIQDGVLFSTVEHYSLDLTDATIFPRSILLEHYPILPDSEIVLLASPLEIAIEKFQVHCLKRQPSSPDFGLIDPATLTALIKLRGS